MSGLFSAVVSFRMPFKFHEAQRHRISKQRYRVRNWPDDDRGLVRRGDIRVWLSVAAIAGWRAACRITPGGQRRFSNLAIETSLILGAVLRLPLRQTEGFVRSLMEIMQVESCRSNHAGRSRCAGSHDTGSAAADSRCL
jgi:hypothetical protein